MAALQSLKDVLFGYISSVHAMGQIL